METFTSLTDLKNKYPSLSARKLDGKIKDNYFILKQNEFNKIEGEIKLETKIENKYKNILYCFYKEVYVDYKIVKLYLVGFSSLWYNVECSGDYFGGKIEDWFFGDYDTNYPYLRGNKNNQDKMINSIKDFYKNYKWLPDNAKEYLGKYYDYVIGL